MMDILVLKKNKNIKEKKEKNLNKNYHIIYNVYKLNFNSIFLL